MMFTKLDAIKALRQLVFDSMPVLQPELVKHDDKGTFTITMGKPYIGLKDAKDFIEKVLSINEKEPLTSIFELYRISVMDGAVRIEKTRVGIYKSRKQAEVVRDNIMRLKAYNNVWETDYDFEIVEVDFGG